MAKKNKSIDAEIRKAQMERQEREIKERLDHIKSKILIMSGKGGVGKSSVAAYLSVALAKKGYRVGLMDVDLHGPSIPRMLGLKGDILPGSHGEKMLPISYLPNHAVHMGDVVSLNYHTALPIGVKSLLDAQMHYGRRFHQLAV